jgi:hypothetical protein
MAFRLSQANVSNEAAGHGQIERVVELASRLAARRSACRYRSGDETGSNRSGEVIGSANVSTGVTSRERPAHQFNSDDGRTRLRPVRFMATLGTSSSSRVSSRGGKRAVQFIRIPGEFQTGSWRATAIRVAARFISRGGVVIADTQNRKYARFSSGGRSVGLASGFVRGLVLGGLHKHRAGVAPGPRETHHQPRLEAGQCLR